MDTADPVFGSVLKGLRQTNNLTQRRLATLLGVSNTQVHRWELGEDLPRLRRFPEIARALNVSTRRLLDAIVEDARAA